MSIATLAGHLAFGLIAFSFLVKDIFWLRIVSIIASLFSVFYNYVIPLEPMWLAINWNFIFIGKEYDIDIIQCYIEIQNVKQVNSIEITNEVLFDLFEDQQNMIKTKINSKQKSFLLNQNNKIAVLNFN